MRGPNRPNRSTGRRSTLGRRFPLARDDQSGLTTLEWLLIVAAVAGLAALAVVLVQNVVGKTAEEVSSGSARKTAALLSANELVRLANRDAVEQPPTAKIYKDWKYHYRSKCRALGVMYGNIGIKVDPRFFVRSNKNNAQVVANQIRVKNADEPKIHRVGQQIAAAQCRFKDQ